MFVLHSAQKFRHNKITAGHLPGAKHDAPFFAAGNDETRPTKYINMNIPEVGVTPGAIVYVAHTDQISIEFPMLSSDNTDESKFT